MVLFWENFRYNKTMVLFSGNFQCIVLRSTQYLAKIS